MSLEIMLTLVAVHAAAVVSPGPNMLSVMDSSLNFGARGTVPLIFGILLGNVIHISYSIVMTSYSVGFSPALRLVFTVAGGVYLAYAGLSRLMNSKPGSPRRFASNGFANGFAVNITNPKGILLFTSIYSIVVPISAPLIFKVSCGLWMLSVNLAFLTALSFAISTKAAAAVVNENLSGINKVTGCVLIVLSIALMLKSASQF